MYPDLCGSIGTVSIFDELCLFDAQKDQVPNLGLVHHLLPDRLNIVTMSEQMVLSLRPGPTSLGG